MATKNERFWEAQGRMKRSFIVTFVNAVGKRQTATFSTNEAADYFLTEILKKEQVWKAKRLLASLEEEAA